MDHLQVWVNDKPVGWLSRSGRGAVFAYEHGVDPADAVSMTMPVRTASYDVKTGMIPVFDTNMPEGYLLERVRAAAAKSDRGRADAFDILTITGGNQIGRIRLLPEGQGPERRAPVDDIDTLLHGRTNADLLKAVIDRYALRSGVSGAMPKVLAQMSEQRSDRTTIQTRDWILKFDDDDLPGLSLNEFHCLEAARIAGNTTADARLSDDGRMLAVYRFDAAGEGRRGFEDFASLNGKTSEKKYEGSIETSLMKTAATFGGAGRAVILEQLYRQVVTSIALRNGDAHLKNYGLLYDNAAAGPVELTPAYDLVTTRVWPHLKDDLMALTLAGTKRWPDAKKVRQLGARARLTPARTDEIMKEVANGIASHIPEMIRDICARGHEDLARNMATEWNAGLVHSLGAPSVRIDPEDPFSSRQSERADTRPAQSGNNEPRPGE